MNVRRAAVVGWFSCMGVGLFTSISSVVALWGMGVIHAYAHPYWQWWLYLPVAFDPLHPTVTRWVWRGALAGFVLPGLGAYRLATLPNVPRLRKSWLRRSAPETIRGVTDNHGHADWLPMDEAQRIFPGPDGTVIGEAYAPGLDPALRGVRFDARNPQTWGKAGTAPLLTDTGSDGARHWISFSGPGGLKTTSAITSLLHWPWSAVVLDPSNEIGPMLTRDRQQRLGHRVYRLDLTDPDACGFNVLDWIDIRSPTAPSDVMTVLQWIGGEAPIDSKDESAARFREGGLDMQAAIMAHMLWSDLPPESKTLRTFYSWLKTPEDKMQAFLRGINATSNSQWARDLASTLMGMKAEETFSGVYFNATGAAKWLANPALSTLVSGSSFRSSDIASGMTTVFLPFDQDVLRHTPGLARVVIGALLKAMYRADGAVDGLAVFLLDEVRRLGPMGMIEEARDMGRKYGIVLGLIYQSVGQMTKQWGQQGTDEWFNAVQHVMFSGVGSYKTARELSDTLGTYTVLATSEGANSGTSSKGMEFGSRSRGTNQSLHEIKRSLMAASEIMFDLRLDERIVVSRGGIKPMRLASPAYFRRPELARLVDENRFHKSEAA